MPGPASAIPVGTQFSPALLDLGKLLAALVDHSGNRDALQKALWSPPVHLKPPHGVPASRRRANLPLEAAAQYGLLEKGSYTATHLAVRLSGLPIAELADEFARHILLNVGGLRVVEGVQQMQADGLKVTADDLSKYLTDQGFRVTVHNTAINTLRMWLARAGIFPEKGWAVDVAAKERVLGLSDDAIGVLASLNPEQRAFVEALCQVNPKGWYKAADVRALAEADSGIRLPRGSQPKQLLDPLATAGLIEYRTKGQPGGKSAELRATAKFRKEVLEPFVTRTVGTLDAPLAAYYKLKPGDIYAAMASNDTFKKGQALEAYAIHIMRLMGLRFIGWRKRAQDTTGRAEVDALLAGPLGGIPTRWQVQCKNTPGGRVVLEDVAKEVGLVPLTKATHVMLIANCPITGGAREYSAEVNRQTSLTVFLLDQADFNTVKKSPGALGRILQARAQEALRQQSSGSLWGVRER